MLVLFTNTKWHTQHCKAISATAELLSVIPALTMQDLTFSPVKQIIKLEDWLQSFRSTCDSALIVLIVSRF